MASVALWTSTRRIGRIAWWAPATAILTGVVPLFLAIFAFGVLPFNALALVAVLGQLSGGSMSTFSLAGRSLHEELDQHYGEVAAALAIGLLPAQARNLAARPAAADVLYPGLDQTCIAGTLPSPERLSGWHWEAKLRWMPSLYS